MSLLRLVSGALLLPLLLPAQQVLLDQGRRVEGLWVFPKAFEAKRWVYIPQAARMAMDDRGRPQFSFLRYATAGPASSGTPVSTQTITTADGGGILHFLVLYDTPGDLVDMVQRTLQKDLKDDEVQITGPLVFQAGTYGLVSSIINPATGTAEKRLLATGRAPVLEGNRVALSFDLTPQQATLLMESLKMATPDVSVVFDMTFLGLTEAYDAVLTVDWSEVHKSQGIKAGGSIYFLSADVDVMFDKLFRNNAIKLKSSGSDAASEGLLNAVYSKLLDLMFRPVDPDRIPPDQRGGVNQAMDALFNSRDGMLSSRKTTSFGLYAGYELKEMQAEGASVMNFNHRATVDRHTYIVFQIGDVYKRYGADAAYFRKLPADDPIFQQREIYLMLDGSVLPDFDKYLNSVSVTFRRPHAGGEPTLREVVFDRQSAAKSLASSVRYTRSGDPAPDWLQYEVRSTWSFKDGGVYQGVWTASDSATFAVTAPYELRTVQILGDTQPLAAKGVRAVVVEVEYDFFSRVKKQQAVVRLANPLPAPFELTLPRNDFGYRFTITWVLDGGRRVVKGGRDTSGVLFIDELPPG